MELFPNNKGWLATGLIIILLLGASGCATLPRNPVPLDLLYEAEVVGAPGVRAWGGEYSQAFQDDFITSVKQEKEHYFTNSETGEKRYAALAISGGGSNGAFGAGFLYGWSSTQHRPVFKIVTGISTGALIAPFAFLGSEYDEVLKEVYTTISTNNIVDRLSIFSILAESESFTRTTPLKALIETYIDLTFLEQIAKAHDEGRRLYIGTTHMDAQRLVIWNMGLISQFGTPEALNLFQKVLLASASIPSAMPPVLINVAVRGQDYDEMHADGGTTTQVFFHGGTINLIEVGKETGIEMDEGAFAQLYILRNGQIAPQPRQISRNLQDISSRALDTMIKTAALNNMYRMYVFSQQEQSQFYYAGIPGDYVSEATEPFDRDEMERLFEIGRQLGASENAWIAGVPGIYGKSKK